MAKVINSFLFVKKFDTYKNINKTRDHSYKIETNKGKAPSLPSVERVILGQTLAFCSLANGG